MNYRWLTLDITGLCSRNEYGKKGDKVTLISEPNVVMSLVEKGSIRFHVRTEYLSDKPLEAVKEIVIEEPEKKVKPAATIRKQKKVPVIPQTIQKDLFQ